MMRPVSDPEDVLRYLGSPLPAILPKLANQIAQNKVLLEGHFELQSGRHSPFFIRFAGLGWNHAAVAELVPTLVDAAKLDTGTPLTVLAPESAGLLLGRAIADYLNADLAVAAIDSRRRPLASLKYGRVTADRRVLVVNDVVTSGNSLEPLLTFPEARLAGLLSFAALSTDPIRRVEARHHIRVGWLVTSTWSTYERSSCPLCAEGKEPPSPAGEFN
jgi:orotate phosphoribosyltransferase